MSHSFAGYTTGEPLYTSGRSIVVLARREGDASACVLKYAADGVVAAEALRRAQFEHDVLRALSCSGVVAVHDLVREGGRVALVLEKFGDALADRLASGPVELDEGIAIAIEVASALAQIHAAGIVHKDLNPRNIVYDAATRRAKIIDFDIAARMRSANPDFVAPVALEGTLRYMSPEQTGRLNRTIDARADIYSLGVTLYELFSGQVPFDGDDALAIVHAHLAVPAPRLTCVPEPIADIIEKALAKAPEHRYQSAAAIAADFEQCRRELGEHGTIARFPLGVHDAARRLDFSDKLYGRGADVRAMLDAFARTAAGGIEAVVIAGMPGIGKSSMVRELYPHVTQRRGFFGAGKFEQLRSDVPYSAVIAALEDLIAQVIAGTELEHWQAVITGAVGDDAALITAVLPCIGAVLARPGITDASAVAPPGDPGLAQRRLASALARLVGVFAQPQHPLVMFLDDMQWADGASLQLITRLLTTVTARSLLVIEAYRDNETAASHPFMLALREAEKHGGTQSRITLAALSVADTTELVADALRRSPADVEEAAHVIWRKTEGNPLFIRRFLQFLDEEGFLAWDAASRSFTLDADAIEKAAISDDVAQLLARQLGKLPDATREAVAVAAAIGSRFDVATLAAVTGRTASELDDVLLAATDAGLLLPVAKLTSSRYAFQHDRIQAAAYASLRDRVRVHLAIGQRLLAEASFEDLAIRPFEIVHHLTIGFPAMQGAETDRFVELSFVAARRARRTGAYDLATKILRAVCVCREHDRHYSAWFDAHYELAEVLSLDGKHLEARALIAHALPFAMPRERAKLEGLEALICTGIGLMAEALGCGRRAAALLGVELPENPADLGRQIEHEVGVIMAAAAASPIPSWIDRPAMIDSTVLEAMNVLANCIGAAYQAEPPLLALIAAKLVTLSLAHGHCGESARGYACFAIVMWVMKQYEACFAFGKLGLDLIDRIGEHPQRAAIEFTFATFASPWKLPFDETIDRLGAMRSSEVTEVTHIGYAMVFQATFRELQGAPLPELIADMRADRKALARMGMCDLERWMCALLAHTRWWAGVPTAPGEPELDFEATDRALVAANASPSAIINLRIHEIERRQWSGDAVGALALVDASRPLLASLVGNPMTTQFSFYACLAALDSGVTDISADRTELAAYAATCPANYRSMVALVDAELARRRGDVAAAIAAYDACIDDAAASGFVKVETLAHELAAEFWLARDKPAFAAIHLGKARDLCEHRGALPRARDLELRRRSLGGVGAVAHDLRTTRSTSAVGSTLDFATVLKASQAVASEIHLDTLLVKIVGIIVENAGAQSGAIVLASDGDLRVHASKQHGAAAVVSGGVPLAGAVPERIVTSVIRTNECVVLADATRHRTFRLDPYVCERQPRSVLCMPIVRQDRMIGAVYLENNLVAGAFTVDRLEALSILIGQLAISIENARMFSRLEDLVAQRTRALTEANAQLREQALVRERMESELRLAQKLQSVGQLAAGVAHEINTPIQFIGDGIAFLGEAFDEVMRILDANVSISDPDLDYLRENVPEACTRALDGIARVSKIVRAMRQFSHPDHEGQSAAQLNHAIESTLIVAQSEYRNVADVITELGTLPDVRCHCGEINQVLLNLIVNAAHAIEDVVRTTGVRGTITIRTRTEGRDAVIEIVDTGGGIPEAVRDRIFDPFFTTKPVGKGTGQGLALARAAIVDRHNGSLTFTSRLGVGTTFTVRIPIDGSALVAAAS